MPTKFARSTLYIQSVRGGTESQDQLSPDICDMAQQATKRGVLWKDESPRRVQNTRHDARLSFPGDKRVAQIGCMRTHDHKLHGKEQYI